MFLIMPNRRVDMDVDVTSTSNACEMPQYDVFNFEEGPRQHMDDGSFHNMLQLSSYNDREDTNLENLKLNKLPQIYYEEIQSSMNDWEEYMYCKEHEVLTKSVLNIENLPDIRGCEAAIQYPERNSIANNNSFSCSKIEIRSHEDMWADDTSEEQRSKKKLHADAERGRGNIAYKAGDYIKACEHYSNSISAIPLKEAYNNRAQANIKLENYNSALPDLNEVLKQDPLNMKALNRRAHCRYHIRMYHEALCDLQSLIDLEPESKKDHLSFMSKVKNEIAALKGRKYRMRLFSNRYKTFEVDVSQLPVYAANEGNYVMEVDKSGCAKSCVCNYCIAEDHNSRYRSTTLRIKERPRWRRLTSELLKELHVDVNAAAGSGSASSAASCSAAVATRCERPKNEYPTLVDGGGAATGGSQKTSMDQFYEKQLRDKNLVNAAYNSSKLASSRLVATTTNAVALPTTTGPIGSTKFMKDSQNLSHQRAAAAAAASIENGMQNLQLKDQCLQNGDLADILKHCSPALLRKKFDSRLDDATLKSLIYFVCSNFETEADWPVMTQYLKAIAELERFKIIISFIDPKTINELMSVFKKAVSLNLEGASHLQDLFFPPPTP